MNNPTFYEQFDKVTTAYFKNKLQPYYSCACFIGNMMNGDETWQYGRRFGYNLLSGSPIESESANKCLTTHANNFYTMQEIVDLEKNFLTVLDSPSLLYTEDTLFDAMNSTLDMLMKLHESKGEVIESFEFKKRKIAHAL